MGDRYLIERPAEDRLADGAERLDERRLRGPPRHVAGLEMNFGDALVVADQEAEQHLRQVAPGLDVEPPHDPEVDGDDIAVSVHQQVAGMQVGVEEAVPEDLVEEGAGRLAQHRVRVVPGGDQGLALVDRDTLHPFEGEHAAAGAPPVHGRHQEAGIFGEVLAQLRGGGRLEAEVHLDHHALGEGMYHLDRAEPPPGGQRPLGERGQPVEELEIALEGALDAWPENLDRDRLARRGDREMHLRDGRRGDGLVGKLPKEGVQRDAELGFDDGPRRARVEGRQTVLQVRERGSGLLAHQVRAGGKRLAELDEARAEHLERTGEPLPRRGPVPACAAPCRRER